MNLLRPGQGVPTPLMWMLALMAGISVANLYYCQPLLNLMRDDMQVTEFQVNLVPVVTQIGYALGLLFIIPLGDMFDRRKTILSSFAALVISLLAVFFSDNMHMLLAASLVTGICSVTPQVFMPFVSYYSLPEEKEKKVGMILSGLLIGILGSRVISGYVGHAFGWRTMYVIAAGMITVSSFFIYRFFPHVEPSYKGGFWTLMGSIGTLILEHPRSLIYSIRSGFAFGSFLGLWGCLAFRMKEAPFFQGCDVVGMLGLCGMAGVLTASSVGKYIPRFGMERISTLGVALHAVAWLVLALFHDSYLGLILGIIIIDIGMQCIQLSNQNGTMSLCPPAASRMNTIYMVSYFIGGSFGTFLAGSLYSAYGWSGTVLAGFIMIVGSVLTTVVGRLLSDQSHLMR